LRLESVHDFEFLEVDNWLFSVLQRYDFILKQPNNLTEKANYILFLTFI
jgi:hypothetical protein